MAIGITVGTEYFSATEATSHSVSLPTANTGEYRVVDMNHSPDGTATIGTVTLPSGWSWAGTSGGTTTGAASNSRLSRIYRKKVGGDADSVSVSTSTAMTLGAIPSTVTGADATTFVDVTPPTDNTGSGNGVSPSITPATTGALVIVSVANDAVPGFGDTDIPSGTTLAGTMANNPPSNGMNLGVAYFVHPTTTATGTKTWSGGAGEEYVASTIAFRESQIEYEVEVATFDKTGTALGSVLCTLWLYNTGDDTASYIAQGTSHATTGLLTFSGLSDNSATHFVTGTKADTPDITDVSERTITPAVSYTGTVDLYLRSQVDKSETAGDGDLRLRSQADKESTGFTLTADAASWTWTGAAAGLEYHSLVAAGSASWAWTGAAASLEYHRVLSAEAASWSWTGQAASLELSSVLDAEAAFWAWTGTAANLELHTVLNAEGTSWAWTGQDATLTHLVGYTLTADPASWAWTGAEASLLQDSLVTAEAASWSWTGQDATLTYLAGFSLSAEAASWSWSGQDTALVLDSVLPAEAAAYTWTGQDASLVYSVVLSAEAASWAWSGDPAGLLIDSVLSAEGALWVWTGADVDLDYSAGEEEQQAGGFPCAPKRPRRFILPDGKVVYGERAALAELSRQLKEKPKPKKKRRKSRSIHAKPSPKEAELPVLLQQRRSAIEPRLLALAEREFTKLEPMKPQPPRSFDEEEEALIVAIILAA